MAEQMVRIDRPIARVAFVSRARALPCVSRRDRRRRRARISRAWQHRQRDPNRAMPCVFRPSQSVQTFGRKVRERCD
jgi:hypothetical protein